MQETTKETTESPQYISIDDFMKVDLRLATIIEATEIPEADKLIQLKVDLGTETRQIFAGIKKAYAPSELVGKTVVIVANLAPRKMRFGISEGMILAAGAGNAEDIWLIHPDEGAKAGMRVK